MKITIVRKRWLRGERNSYLFREKDGKMCCVGFFAKALGHKVSQISGKSIITQIRDTTLYSKLRWCSRNNHLLDNSDIMKLYETNDKISTTDERKEKSIKRLFKRHKVEVEFI